ASGGGALARALLLAAAARVGGVLRRRARPRHRGGGAPDLPAAPGRHPPRRAPAPRGLRVLRAALPRRRPAPQGPARDLGGTRRHAGGKGRAAVGHADRARPARRVLRCPAPALARAERARVTGSDSTAEIYDRAAQNWR